MQQAIRTLEISIEEIQRKLSDNREAADAIQANNQRLQDVRDRATRRAYILGRVELYLEASAVTRYKRFATENKSFVGGDKNA